MDGVQYGIPDPASTNAQQQTGVLGIAGLFGTNPIAPEVRGAVPLTDPRARFNNRATFCFRNKLTCLDPLNTQ